MIRYISTSDGSKSSDEDDDDNEISTSSSNEDDSSSLYQSSDKLSEFSSAVEDYLYDDLGYPEREEMREKIRSEDYNMLKM